MRVLIRVKYRFLGFTIGTDRKAFGISHDELGNWTIGRINDPKDLDFITAKKIFDRWGVLVATTGTII